VIFSRANDIRVDDVNLFYSALTAGGHDGGTILSSQVNVPGKSTYAPMLDWSQRGRFTFTGQRPEAHLGAADVYVLQYRVK